MAYWYVMDGAEYGLWEGLPIGANGEIWTPYLQLGVTCQWTKNWRALAVCEEMKKIEKFCLTESTLSQLHHFIGCPYQEVHMIITSTFGNISGQIIIGHRSQIIFTTLHTHYLFPYLCFESLIIFSMAISGTGICLKINSKEIQLSPLIKMLQHYLFITSNGSSDEIHLSGASCLCLSWSNSWATQWEGRQTCLSRNETTPRPECNSVIVAALLPLPGELQMQSKTHVTRVMQLTLKLWPDFRIMVNA